MELPGPLIIQSLKNKKKIDSEKNCSQKNPFLREKNPS